MSLYKKRLTDIYSQPVCRQYRGERHKFSDLKSFLTGSFSFCSSLAWSTIFKDIKLLGWGKVMPHIIFFIWKFDLSELSSFDKWHKNVFQAIKYWNIDELKIIMSPPQVRQQGHPSDPQPHGDQQSPNDCKSQLCL